jgi:hypothetical protein
VSSTCEAKLPRSLKRLKQKQRSKKIRKKLDADIKNVPYSPFCADDSKTAKAELQSATLFKN